MTWDSCFDPRRLEWTPSVRRRGPRGPGWRPPRPSPPSSPTPGPRRALTRRCKVGPACQEPGEGFIHPEIFSQAWVAWYCADTAKILLLTEIEILFSEWFSEAAQRFYCSPDINKVQHTISQCTVWLSSPLSPEFNFPALCSVRSGHCCFLRGPSVQGWQGWLPVHGWVMIIFLPPSAGHQPIRGCYQLSLTNQRPALPLLISLFCPHQSSYWWGITRTIIMLEPGQEN